MIIIQNPIKDTYVTDIQTSSNNGMFSNVGQSSTIDFFKIASENGKTFSRSLLTINSNIINGNTFTLKDSLGNSIIFVIRTLELTVDGSVEVDGENKKVKIGLSEAGTLEQKRDRFFSAINNVNSFNNGLTFDITAYKLYDDKILLKQNKSGVSGDTSPIIPEGQNSVSITNFTRFEHSAGLIKFDLASLKNEHLPDSSLIANSVFKDIANPKFSASIKLIDVGQSSTRAKDFSLSLDVLSNDFNEGLGKDVIHFSDVGDSNFSVLDSKNNKNWSIEGIVSKNDLFTSSEFSFNDFQFETGKEDLEFDITNYFHEFFTGTANLNKENFVIHFPLGFLFDNKTYFVKRFGSRNLKNKQFIPQLILKIDDNEIENIVLDKKRYFDNEEEFYLLNVKGNKTKPFTSGNHVKLKFSYIGDGSSNIYNTFTVGNSEVSHLSGNDIFNYKGSKLEGIKKFVVPDTVIEQINSDSIFSAELSRLGYVTVELEYYYESIADSTVTSSIKKDKVKFYLPETDQDQISFNNRNIRVSIDLLQKEIKANNSTINLKISFIDINKQYKSVNTPIQLYSEDLGVITYEMNDVDSGVSLIKDELQYTQLKFNGKHYIMNLFSSENFKNKRVNFTFSYTDPFTGLKKKISNDNTILRFV